MKVIQTNHGNTFRKVLPLLAFVLAIGLFVGFGRMTAYAKDSEDVVPVYRLYNLTSLEHLYTTNYTEYQNCVKAGWKDEGIGWYAPKTSNWPVRRLYHAPTGYHLYSQNPIEMNMLVSAGWKLEGIGFYSSEKKEVEIRRQFNPTNHLHNYSYNQAEIQFLGEHGWKLEGTAWFARKTPPGAPIGIITPDDGPSAEESAALKAARERLAQTGNLSGGISRSSLEELLTDTQGFSQEAAAFALEVIEENNEVDWTEQARFTAYYLEYYYPTLPNELYQYLIDQGFTEEQAGAATEDPGMEWTKIGSAYLWNWYQDQMERYSMYGLAEILMNGGMNMGDAINTVQGFTSINYNENAIRAANEHYDLETISREELIDKMINHLYFAQEEAEYAANYWGIY